MVCDKCGKQNVVHLENGKPWCSWCNDWAMSAEEETKISKPEELKRCAQCGQMFREAENHDAACSYHTGRLWECDKYAEPGSGLPGDFWDCCDRIIGNDGAIGPGCAVGRHREAAPDDPGPIERDLEAYKRAMRKSSAEISSDYRRYPSSAPSERIDFARWRVRRFLAGRLIDPEYETARAPEDVAILEHHCLGWLLLRMANARFAVGRRHLIAALAVDPWNRDRLQRAVNQASA